MVAVGGNGGDGDDGGDEAVVLRVQTEFLLRTLPRYGVTSTSTES